MELITVTIPEDKIHWGDNPALIIGIWTKYAMRQKFNKDQIDATISYATSKDYEHFIDTMINQTQEV